LRLSRSSHEYGRDPKSPDSPRAWVREFSYQATRLVERIADASNRRFAPSEHLRSSLLRVLTVRHWVCRIVRTCWLRLAPPFVSCVSHFLSLEMRPFTYCFFCLVVFFMVVWDHALGSALQVVDHFRCFAGRFLGSPRRLQARLAPWFLSCCLVGLMACPSCWP